MRKKGQALVEFIIILPVFLMILLGVIDLGRILYSKIILEEQMSNIINLYDEGKREEEIIKELKLEDVSLEIKNDNEYLDFKVIKKIDIITPGLNVVLKNPYSLKITRSTKNGT